MTPLADWLRRRRPDRVVLRPGGAEWKRPDVRPWQQLADLAASAEALEAYAGDRFIGVWRREAPPPAAPTPAPAAASPAGGGWRDELDAMREIIRAQSSMLRDLVAAHGVAVRSMRGAARLLPAEDDDDDDDAPEDDGTSKAVRAALLRELGMSADASATTDELLLQALGRQRPGPAA